MAGRPTQLSADFAPQLLDLLANTISNEDTGRKNALKSLEEWEQIPGYCSLLHYIILNKQIDAGLRFIAISCFKNAVHKYWIPRNQKTISITPQEKLSIREKLHELLDEENNLNAVHIALLYAKIARLDFPKEWPQVLHQLISIGQDASSSDLRKLRVLLTLKFTVKALSTKVLMISRSQFQKITPDVLQYVGEIWGNTNSQFLSCLASIVKGEADTPNIGATMEACKLTLQSMKPLLQYGIPKLNQNQISSELLMALLPSLREYIQYARVKSLPDVFADYVKKYIILICKMIVTLHKHRPGPFEPFLVPYLELMWGEISNLSLELTSVSPVLERLAVYCLRYIKNVISEHYFSADRDTGSKQEETIREQKIIRELLTAPRITQLAELLISKFLCLSPDDLELWQSDPEEFVSDMAADDFSFHVRPAAQALLGVCQSKFEEILAAHVVQLLQQVAFKADETLQNALLRDACYQALGSSYDQSFANIPFQNWLDEFFMRDLNHPSRQHFMILSRRIAWLLGCWVTKVTDDSRPVVYEILLRLMEDSDLVIQLTAAEGLAYVIDDLNFNIDPFAEYVPRTVTQLFQLMQKVSETSTKMKLINHLGVVIEQSHSKVFPFARQILEHLTQLWGSVSQEEQGMMRSTVIRSIEKLVSVLEHRSGDHYDVLFPLIKVSTDVHQHEAIYTLEDGMSVWLTVLQQASSVHRGFLDLFDNLPAIIGNSFEYTVPCMNILECYILMGGEEFLAKHGASLVSIYNCMLGDVNSIGTSLVVKNMHTMVECFPSQALVFLEDMFVKILGLLFDDKESEQCKREYVSLLSFVIMKNSLYFMQLNNKLLQIHQTDVLPKFLDYVFDMIERETDLNLRKKIGLAVCSLLPVGGAAVVIRLPQVIDLIVSVIIDGERVVDVNDLFDLDDEDEDDDEPTGSVVNEMKYQLYKKQRVWQKENLQLLTRQSIQQCLQVYGTEFQQALQRIPQSILAKLQ